MKKYLLSLVFLFVACYMGFGQFNFGAGGHLIGDGTHFGVQGKALYAVNDNVDAAAAFTFHLGDTYEWTIDADAHYNLLEISDNIKIAPFAGLTYTNAVDSKIGLNLGGFIDFVAGEKERHIYIEPKVVVGGLSSFVLSAGLLL